MGKYLIAYQCLHKAFRTFKGKCHFSSFPNCHSTINKQVSAAGRIVRCTLSRPDDQLGGLRVEAKATCFELGHQATPEQLAWHCEGRLKVFTALVLHGVFDMKDPG